MGCNSRSLTRKNQRTSATKRSLIKLSMNCETRYIHHYLITQSNPNHVIVSRVGPELDHLIHLFENHECRDATVETTSPVPLVVLQSGLHAPHPIINDQMLSSPASEPTLEEIHPASDDSLVVLHPQPTAKHIEPIDVKTAFPILASWHQ